MLKQLFIVPVCLLIVTGAISQPLNGVYTLPGTVNSTQVNNLTQLAAVVNGSTVNGTAIFEFTQAYAGGETYPIVFSAFSGGGKVVIRPAASVASALTTAGAPGSAALIDLNNVNNLTFDGRPGGTGSAVQWQFQNVASSGTYPVFRFINGASYNTLQYLAIQASGSSAGSTVLFSTSTTGTGNSNDTVQYCNIGNYAGYPYNPVLSNGTAGAAANANNSILNNSIYNFQCFNNTSPYYGGINIGATGNGSNWNISGNSFYSTINPLTIGSYPCRAIYFNAGANSTGNVISGNYIGGQAPLCGGAPWQVAAYGANGYADFDGIYVSAGGTTRVSGNTIQNITMASRYGSSTFRGINIVGGSAEVTGNLIGSLTAPHSILSGLYGTMLGIQNQSSGTVLISNNVVANITANGSSYVSGTSSTTTGVTIGIYGYNSGLLGPCTVHHNQVYNFSRIDNYNNNLYFPVSSGGGVSGQTNIYQQNIIAGICVQTTGSASQAITANTVYNLYDSITGGTSRIYLNGIVMNAAAGTHTVSGNFVYGLWTLDNFGGSSYYAGLNGIYLPTSFSGTYLVYNNMVNLGYRPNGTSVQNALITGIWDNTDFNNANLKLRIYHNSVYIGGTNNNAFSNNLNSYAFRRMLSYSSAVYDSVVLKNNIFVNNRTTAAGTGKNYGIYWNALTNAEGNYNDIYGTGTNYICGNAGGTDYATLAAYNVANATQEPNSIAADPLYSSPNSGSFDLHIGAASPCDQAGTATLTATYDFDSVVRANATPVDMGATTTCAGGAAPSIILSSVQDSICPGGTMNFNVSGSNWGGNAAISFYVNNIVKQTGTSAAFTAANLAEGDSVTATVTTSGGCNSGATATSNKVYVHVASAVLPSVILTPSASVVCLGEAVNFTATATGGGSAPVYNFYLNGASVQNGASATYSGSNLSSTDSVYVILTSNAACASPITARSNAVKIIVNLPQLTQQSAVICPGDVYQFHNIPLSQPGFYYDTINAVNGCDSIIALNLTVRAIDSTIFTASICQGGSYTFNGTLLSQPGTYRDTITGAAGCDSILILHLTTAAAIATTLTEAICAGTAYTFNGQSLTAAGTYLDTLTAAGGCDSIITLHLTVRNTDSTLLAVAICQGGNYNFNGTVISQPGTYRDTIMASTGCDSILVLQLTSATAITTTITGAVCPGSSYSFNGQNLTAAGTYMDTLVATGGCDSIVRLNITLYNIDSTTYTATICQGSSYNFNGTLLTQPGTYRDTLTAATGCDSILVLHLTTAGAVSTMFTDSVCAGDSYAFNGQNLTVAGTFMDTLTAAGGCDSVVTLHLLLHAGPSPSITVNGIDTLTTGAYSSYQWLLNNAPVANATGNTLITAIDGIYSVVVADAFGCSDTSAAVSVIHAGIAVAEMPNVHIYPNPAQGVLNIVLGNTYSNSINIQLTDLAGRVAVAGEIATGQGSTYQLNLQSLSAGTYLLCVNGNGMQVFKKVQILK